MPGTKTLAGTTKAQDSVVMLAQSIKERNRAEKEKEVLGEGAGRVLQFKIKF